MPHFLFLKIQGNEEEKFGNKSLVACTAELNSTSPNMKSKYSSLAKKINLLNNQGICDLQYEGCLFTKRYYTKEINSHLLITLYNPQTNDQGSDVHACTVKVGGGGGVWVVTLLIQIS